MRFPPHGVRLNEDVESSGGKGNPVCRREPASCGPGEAEAPRDGQGPVVYPPIAKGVLAMSTSMTNRYEFTEAQNREIGGLARRMRLVGLVAIVLGVVNLILSLLLLVYAFRDRLPAEALRRIPEDTLRQLAPPSQLWAIVLQAAASGLIFLLIGLWTRSSAAEFRKIVDTAGRDIGHLMSALGSLHKMYSLLYTLIIVGILAFLVSIGVFLYARYSGLPTIARGEAPDVNTSAVKIIIPKG